MWVSWGQRKLAKLVEQSPNDLYWPILIQMRIIRNNKDQISIRLSGAFLRNAGQRCASFRHRQNPAFFSAQRMCRVSCFKTINNSKNPAPLACDREPLDVIKKLAVLIKMSNNSNNNNTHSQKHLVY